jgi:DNA-binding XRE family transcriptional regulator
MLQPLTHTKRLTLIYISATMLLLPAPLRRIPLAAYTPQSDFGSRIARAGLTQAELARLADVSKFAINRMVKGEYEAAIREATAWRIARAFAQAANISEEDAFGQLFALFAEKTDDQKNVAPLYAAA